MMSPIFSLFDSRLPPLPPHCLPARSIFFPSASHSFLVRSHLRRTGNLRQKLGPPFECPCARWQNGLDPTTTKRKKETRRGELRVSCPSRMDQRENAYSGRHGGRGMKIASGIGKELGASQFAYFSVTPVSLLLLLLLVARIERVEKAK